MNYLNVNYMILFGLLLIQTSCGNPLEKKVGTLEISKVKELLEGIDSLSLSEREFILDNLKGNDQKEITYNTYVNDYLEQFRVLDSEARNQIEVNEKLTEMFFGIEDILGVCLTDCYYNSQLSFKNPFEKDIRYIEISYKYVDEYDRGFNGVAKITDEPNQYNKNQLPANFAAGASGTYELTLSSTGTKGGLWQLPFERQDISQQLNVDNFSIEVNKVVFTDRTNVIHNDVDWKYIQE